MKWFKDRKPGRLELNRIRSLVIDRWNADFKGEDEVPVPAPGRTKVISDIILNIIATDKYLCSQDQSGLHQ